MRLFVAVDPPAFARDHLAARLHELTLHDLSVHDRSLEGPAPLDPAQRDPALLDRSLTGPALREPAQLDPGPLDRAPLDPAPLDPALLDHGRLRWISPGQWHVTLAFLAEVPNSEVTTLSGQLADTAQSLTGFSVALAGAGAFPHPPRASTLWCGIDPGGAELSTLAQAVAGATRTAALSLDERPFRPHLTLARCQPSDLQPIVARLADYRGPQFTVDEISLVRSHLGKGPGGSAAHETIGRWPLGADQVPATSSRSAEPVTTTAPRPAL